MAAPSLKSPTEDDKWACLGPLVRRIPTPEEADRRETLKAELVAKYAGDDAALAFLNDDTMRRYMWAHHFDVAKARTNIEATIKWRSEVITRDLHCTACVSKEDTHCFFNVGFDRHGRPIMYCAPARAATMEGPETIRHIVAEQEHAFRDPLRADNWTWIFDVRGLGLFSGNLSVSVGKEFVSTFTAHYPERLGVSILYDPPTVVDWLYSALKPFMDPVTVRKNVMVKAKDVEAVVGALASSETQAAWLLAALTRPITEPLPPLPPDAPLPTYKSVPARAKGGL